MTPPYDVISLYCLRAMNKRYRAWLLVAQASLASPLRGALLGSALQHLVSRKAGQRQRTMKALTGATRYPRQQGSFLQSQVQHHGKQLSSYGFGSKTGLLSLLACACQSTCEGLSKGAWVDCWEFEDYIR